jgi:very-short-patch-repair endonuclease
MTAVELDGEGTHLDRVAFQADRTKRNRLQLLGWRVLAFTWRDHLERFDQLLSLVEQALALAAPPDSGDS